MGSFSVPQGQGTVFVTSTEPTAWVDGELWVDLAQDPPILKLNNAGTAVEASALAGLTTAVDVASNGSVGQDTITPLDDSLSTSYATLATAAITPTKTTNKIFICGWAVCNSQSGSPKLGMKVLDVATEVIAEVLKSLETSDLSSSVQITATLTDVTAEAHTYNLQLKSDTSTTLDLEGCGIAVFGSE